MSRQIGMQKKMIEQAVDSALECKRDILCVSTSEQLALQATIQAQQLIELRGKSYTITFRDMSTPAIITTLHLENGSRIFFEDVSKARTQSRELNPFFEFKDEAAGISDKDWTLIGNSVKQKGASHA